MHVSIFYCILGTLGLLLLVDGDLEIWKPVLLGKKLFGKETDKW